MNKGMQTTWVMRNEDVAIANLYNAQCQKNMPNWYAHTR